MSFGQVLDRTYRLVRGNFGLLLKIALLPFGAFLFTYLIVGGCAFLFLFHGHLTTPPDPRVLFPYLLPLMVVVGLPMLAVFALYLAATLHAGMQADCGIRVTFSEAFSAARGRASRYFLLLLWLYVRCFGPALLVDLAMIGIFGVFGMVSPNPNPAVFLVFPLAMLLYLAAFIYGVFVAIQLSLAFPACVEEQLDITASCKRSRMLTSDAKGRIFLVLLVIYGLCYVGFMVLFAVLAVLAGITVFVVSSMQIHFVAPWSYIGIGALVVCAMSVFFVWTAIVYGSLATALAVLYHDQRLRKDTPPLAPVQPVLPV
jgi:hypothetical protein